VRRPSRSARTDLAVLTAAKVVSNTALRWVGPFLPTLERAFSTTTGTLTGVMGVCELGGLTTVATGPALDRGHERRLFVLGLLAVAVSSAVALGGSVTTFAISFGLLVLGVSNLTVAGHAWIGHRVPFAARGRAIGVFETSWAIALLVGAPILAVLIATAGWRGPYVLLAVGAVVAALAVLTWVSPGRAVPRRPHDHRAPLPRTAWAPMVASAATAAAGLGTFVVSGVWLDDAHGVSTGGLGIVAAAFGVVELASSGTVAGFGDRIGARTSVLAGLVVLGLGVVVMLTSGDSRGLAITGLLVFLTGFEFAFVSSLTLVTEAAPAARGRAIGLSNAMGTVARAGAVFLSGQLYEASGMSGSLTMASAAAGTALVATVATRRP
jgi:MFS transporter, DHA1 family, inner membrane transport protein